ncbi:MAG: cob(I)yrinic acid a,c-diamide adenosyltransferase [Rikenellaceae bacterium]
MKVYTKSGDKGTTALIGGDRVAKNDIRVEAYGTVDELSAFIGLLSDKIKAEATTMKYAEELYQINSMLMNLEAHLAAGEDIDFELPAITDLSIELLERSIDQMQSSVPAITKFTIPGGHEIISLCHVCRTICRRAERCSISVAEQFKIDESVVKYLNRLSDYLYLLGRISAHLLNIDEILWRP